MCVFGGDDAGDEAAERQREQERKRQKALNKGHKKIQKEFSKYDDEFFEGIREDYQGYYEPQLEDQYTDASKQKTFNLARQGNLETSTAANQFGDLQERRNKEEARLADRAISAEQDARGRVAQAQQRAVQDLYMTENPQQAAQAAAAYAVDATKPPDYSPMGQVFGDLLRQGGTAYVAEQNGQQGWGGAATSLVNTVADPLSGGNKSKVVR